MQQPQRHMLFFKFALGGSLLLILFSIGVAFMPLGHSTAQDSATMTPTITPAPRLELNEERIKRATVFIMQTYESRGQQVISCVGSGSLVSSDGLILTNAHIALPSEICRADRIVISITVNLNEPPIPTYTAEIVDSSKGLDLAVLRINGYLDGREIEPGTLHLPFVELGDSLGVTLDDTITVVGYADFGNAPVDTRRGTISGFTAESRAGDRAWIRTSASIPGTISGGGAYNRDGKLIGIPTIAPARAAGEILNCRVIQDTNDDGRADDNDRCVPVGGFISALRPSRLARGLVRAAALNIQQGGDLTPDLPATTTAQPVFRRLFFTTRINEAGVPANVVGGVPTGTTSLYLFFDYANMVDGMVYELRVTIDDVPNTTYSLPPITWSGGANGTWFIGSTGIPWPNGEYNFRLFIEGRETASKRISIGGGPTMEPQFTDIVFGVLDDSGNLAGTSYVLPEGSAIQARFNYRNMQPDASWSYIWYFNGQELLRDTIAWEGDTQGAFVMPAAGEFLPGPYRLELYVNNALSATADFVIAGGAEVYTTQIFSNFEFTDAQIAGIPTGTIRTDFPDRPQELYVFFDWRLLAPGTPWTRRWLVDDETLFEITEPWDANTSGADYYVGLRSLDLLPDATYTFEIILANVVQARVEAKIGLGQLRAEEFESAEGVQMIGRITDAETGLGIPGAIFIVLLSEYSVEDFLWQEAQVLGFSLADSNGYFQVEELLERGSLQEDVLYSVVVRAEGYLPV
ncbi:MAG: serine protease, partial [Anaerolineae bacterium]|nr:serine protease [Anaerolineae bacterium]